MSSYIIFAEENKVKRKVKSIWWQSFSYPTCAYWIFNVRIKFFELKCVTATFFPCSSYILYVHKINIPNWKLFEHWIETIRKLICGIDRILLPWNKRNFFFPHIKIEFNFQKTVLVHQQGVISLLWSTNMAAMISCENNLYILHLLYRCICNVASCS